MAQALNPRVPWVWLAHRSPKPALAWWPTRISLAEGGAPHDVKVRLLQFDLRLPTGRFLELLPEFAGQGVALFQLDRPVPDTLSLDALPAAAIDRVLVQHGLHLSFHLPHAQETAQFRAPRPGFHRLNPLARSGSATSLAPCVYPAP